MVTRRKIDWLRLEAEIKTALSRYSAGKVLAVDTCRVIDALIAQATGRGAVLPYEPLPWEDNRSEDEARRVVPEWYEDE